MNVYFAYLGMKTKLPFKQKAADGEDMMDVEIQRRIEAEIRRKNVEENLNVCYTKNVDHKRECLILKMDATECDGVQSRIIWPSRHALH